jgi:ABC-type transport system involved in multi-copper enzyme maturation permease subunit
MLITITARTNLTDYPHKPTMQNAIILYLILSCSGFWMGISNSIQEICKERNILKREYMAGLRLDAYVLSKMIVIAIISAAQSLMIASIFAWGIQMKGKGIFFGPFYEILFTTFLTIFAAATMGVFVSSLFNEPAKAMAVAPLLMIPQLIFSGGTISVKDPLLKWASCATVCRWSISSYGATEGFKNIVRLEANREAPKQAEESAAIEWGKVASTGGAVMGKDEFIAMRLNSRENMKWYVETSIEKGIEILDRKGVNFKSSKKNLAGNWLILCAFIVCFSIAPIFALRNINSEKR